MRRLRIALLLGVLAASAIAVSPAEATSTAGCSSTKPAAAGKAKPSFKRPAIVLAKGKRYSIVMNTTCGQIRIALDRKLGGAIPNSIAFLARSTSSTVSPSTAWSRASSCRAAIRGQRHGGPGYEVGGALPNTYRYKLGDIAMAKTATAPSAPRGRSSSSSRARGPLLPPQYGLLGHAATRPRWRRSSASQRWRTLCDCPPRKKVWIVTARLVTLP